MNPIKLTAEQSAKFLKNKTVEPGAVVDLDARRHTAIAYQNQKKLYEIRLPLPYPFIKEDEDVQNYLNRIEKTFSPYAIILVQAGYAAVGYFDADTVVHHKALRAYMVRKGQGRSQLAFSKNGKGKSSGSQLRNQNAIHFFEDINRTLNDWNIINNCERILYSCPINLWGFLHNSKIKCPFGKTDPRLHKIPIDVRVPNYEELLRINKLITSGYLTYCDS